MPERDQIPSEKKKSSERLLDKSRLSLAGGTYVDPNPEIIEYIHNRFEVPAENTEATLMKAFELAGIVKTISEIEAMAQPLEHTGLLPAEKKAEDEQPFIYDSSKDNSFIDLKDERILLMFQEGNDARNALLLRVREMTEARMNLNESEIKNLRNFGKAFRHQLEGPPPALEIVAVIAGLVDPENPAKKAKIEAPELTREIATDVYWMVLREEVKLSTNIQRAVS